MALGFLLVRAGERVEAGEGGDIDEEKDAAESEEEPDESTLRSKEDALLSSGFTFARKKTNEGRTGTQASGLRKSANL